MRILLATFGSRGDVEPFLALGLGLKGVGHDVVLSTAHRFEGWIDAHGLTAHAITDELLDVMDTDDGRAVLDPGGRPITAMRAGVRINRLAMPINEQMMRETWEIAQAFGPGLIVYHPKALAAPHIAEKLGIPAALGVLQPMLVPTVAFPVAGLPALPIGGWFNRLTYRVVGAGHGVYTKAIDRFRTDVLDLGAAPKGMGPMHDARGKAIPILHAFSRHIVRRPVDWPPHAHGCGAWTLPTDPAWAPPDDLAAFLRAGPPPVYFGFGSIAGRDPKALAATAIAALAKAGQRGVLATGWGGLQPGDVPESVFVLDRAPHAWLFPQMAATVHHGGAGTTAAALTAGRPTLVCPFFGDQGFWGGRVAQLGAGPEPIPQRRVTVDRLAAAIRDMVSDTQMRANAARLGEALRAEDGVANTIPIVECLSRSASAA